MKKIFLTVTLSIIFAVSNFAQTNCTIEPGRGCGEIRIGSSRSQIEAKFGKANDGNYFSSGFDVNYNSLEKVEKITFLFRDSPLIWVKYSAFRGGLSNGLTINSTPEQIIAKYGTPLERKDWQVGGIPITYLRFASVEFTFSATKLSYMRVWASNPSDLSLSDSNQSIDSTPSPSATEQPPTPDCKYILNFDKCRNILFSLTGDDLVNYFGNTKSEKVGMVTQYSYNGMLVDVANTNLVSEVEFTSFGTGRLPDIDITWGAGKNKIIKRLRQC